MLRGICYGILTAAAIFGAMWFFVWSGGQAMPGWCKHRHEVTGGQDPLLAVTATERRSTAVVEGSPAAVTVAVHADPRPAEAGATTAAPKEAPVATDAAEPSQFQFRNSGDELSEMADEPIYPDYPDPQVREQDV